MEKKIAGCVVIASEPDPKDVVVTLTEDDDDEKVIIKTEKANGDIYLVLEIKDILRFFHNLGKVSMIWQNGDRTV